MLKSEDIKVKVKKTDLATDMLAAISSSTGIDAEKLRLWKFETRQNYVSRPQSILTKFGEHDNILSSLFAVLLFPDVSPLDPIVCKRNPAAVTLDLCWLLAVVVCYLWRSVWEFDRTTCPATRPSSLLRRSPVLQRTSLACLISSLSSSFSILRSSFS